MTNNWKFIVLGAISAIALVFVNAVVLSPVRNQAAAPASLPSELLGISK